MLDQVIVFGTLGLTLLLFMFGRWRYDIVALIALLTVTVTGVVAGADAFVGFGHPAVVAVAGVLVVSRGLQNSGVVDALARSLSWVGSGATVQVAALTCVVTVCSAFMNNVGALALLMPVAIQMARKHGHSPSLVLMPLAFGSLLGGMTTLIGTPPNIIIGTYRAQTGAGAFRMFDFSPVGVAVAMVGVAFIALVGWRLIPQRKGATSRADLFHIEEYTTEVRVPENSVFAGQAVREIEATAEIDVTLVGVIRAERRVPLPSSYEIIRPGDVLIVEASSDDLKVLVDKGGLELVGSDPLGEEILGSDDVSLIEAVVSSDSSVVGHTSRGLNLRWRYGVNLLAVARNGARLHDRVSNISLRAGDVLLLQGPSESIGETIGLLGCLPLAERDLRIGQPRRLLVAGLLFGLALLTAATGTLPVHVAFVTSALLMVLLRVLSSREAYAAVDWSVLVLLGAMIPVGQALEATGGAQQIADGLLSVASSLPAWATLLVVLVGTMFLSDIVNNAAAAVLMAPIAVQVARGLEASPDPFLMSVAIGASCAFLTPIGHQSNTLVMGPGGYQFGDYWRMGLALEILIVGVSIPMLLWFWPL